MTTIAERPGLGELVKAAMAGTVDRASITAEALRQSQQHDESDEGEKTASAEVTPEHYSTEQIHKLAGALNFIATNVKMASPALSPGHGPGALTVTESAKGGGAPLEPGHSGQAIAKNIVPKTPKTQAEKVQGGKANTGLETNDDVMVRGKTVLAAANLERVMKLASKAAPAAAPATKVAGLDVGMLRKVAEDALNPAKISAGAAVPPDASEAGQGVPSEPSDVTSQKSMIASNTAAIDYTKGQAKAQPKREVSSLPSQPALTVAGDNVLQKTLDHTGAAGVKISMVQDSLRVKAARALLSNLMDKVASEEDKKNKKKESTMGAAPATPSASSGFTASTL